MRNSHDSVLAEMEGLQQHLKEEQTKVLSLQNQLSSGTTSQRTIMEV